jgi:hypothetical protein
MAMVVAAPGRRGSVASTVILGRNLWSAPHIKEDKYYPFGKKFSPSILFYICLRMLHRRVIWLFYICSEDVI